MSFLDGDFDALDNLFLKNVGPKFPPLAGFRTNRVREGL